MAFLETLNGKLTTKDGRVIDNVPEHMKGKVILAYFTAKWCPQSGRFTPELKKFYDKYHESGEFEIIFVSSDTSKEKMDSYFKGNDMPDCLALENGCEEANTLKYNCSVSDIPRPVVINEEGRMLHYNTRSHLSYSPDTAAAKWHEIKTKNTPY